MPDIIAVITKRWKLIIALTLIATTLALIVSLLRPKEYLSTVTAVPANSLIADKARIFSSNIEALYSELGSPDELDRIEGTAKLDTIFLAVADSFNLAAHYQVAEGSSTLEVAWRLKKNTDIRRTAYGELKIKAWDADPALAAQLANALLQKLNEIHQQLQNANHAHVLQKIREELSAKQKDTVSFSSQIKEYQTLIHQYELAIKTAPQALIVVEPARTSATPDKPKTGITTAVAFFASLLFSLLLAVFVESRKATT